MLGPTPAAACPGYPTPAAACPGLRSTASAGGSTRRPMAPSYHCGKALFSVSNLRSYHLSQGAYARANPFVSQGGGGGTRFTLLLSGGGGSTAAESPPRALGTNEPRGLAASEVSLPAPVWRNFSQRPAGASSGRRMAAKTLAIFGWAAHSATSGKQNARTTPARCRTATYSMSTRMTPFTS